MQTSAVYNLSFHSAVVIAQPVANTPWMPRASRSLRTLARKWDLIGVLSLMASSAAYSVYALVGTGF